MIYDSMIGVVGVDERYDGGERKVVTRKKVVRSGCFK